MINIFTGLVEEMGKIISVEAGDKSIKIAIKCAKVIKGAKVGDSIATNGVCLTATELGPNYFIADCMYETIKRTNLKRLKAGDSVNLEKSLTLATPLGGHLVTGDIDCEGVISNITSEGIARIYEIKIKTELMKYIVEKGRITLDGASLTIVDFGTETLSVSLIPHTQKSLIIGKKNIGDYVNVEVDLFGKYVERILTFPSEINSDNSKNKNKVTKAFLEENGFF